MIKGLVVPRRPEFDADSIARWLAHLSFRGLIHWYTDSHGERYLHIMGWERGQYAMRKDREPDSGCPDHDSPECRPVDLAPYQDAFPGDFQVAPDGSWHLARRELAHRQTRARQ